MEEILDCFLLKISSQGATTNRLSSVCREVVDPAATLPYQDAVVTKELLAEVIVGVRILEDRLDLTAKNSILRFVNGLDWNLPGGGLGCILLIKFCLSPTLCPVLTIRDPDACGREKIYLVKAFSLA